MVRLGLLHGFIGILAFAVHAARSKDFAAAFSAQEYESGAVMDQLMQEKTVSQGLQSQLQLAQQSDAQTNFRFLGAMERNESSRTFRPGPISSHRPIRALREWPRCGGSGKSFATVPMQQCKL
jgi:transcription initiation factor TFIID subunit TAF12